MSEETTDRILDYLNQFKSPDAIAEECRRLGVKGITGDCKCCVVAKLVINRFGEMPIYASPSTYGCFAYISFSHDSSVTLPPAVNAFALAFDSGEYPDLVEG